MTAVRSTATYFTPAFLMMDLIAIGTFDTIFSLADLSLANGTDRGLAGIQGLTEQHIQVGGQGDRLFTFRTLKGAPPVLAGESDFHTTFTGYDILGHNNESNI